MNESPQRASTCPRCGRSTTSPFVVGGVCLLCAGERVLGGEFGVAASSHSAGGDASARISAVTLPDRIGPYEIIDELGRGGMGYVYAARQIELGRIVALKVLASRGDLAGLDLRFLREAQTVARLHHPNIVAVYDSGRADGYVYFSMEYFEGGDLGRRLRERPFAPREAASLVEKIAGAAAAAHAEGVLHRDIKPSNILMDDDEPKLADFGLAAQLETGGDLTAVSGVLGTPHYLAPEALRGGSAALTIASDVYALGAVLFELLTGRTPFAGVSPAELAALIETTEPPSPRLIAPVVPSDLETICLKCLERDPLRRYATAGALADDLARFRRNEPIHARPPGPWGRSLKFAARHRAGVVAAAVTTFVLVAATAVSLTLAFRAKRAERDRAFEAATANAVVDFLTNDLLAKANPSEQPDRNITLHAVVDRAAKKIDGRFPDQPLIAADLHSVVGEVYDSLADYETARQHLEKAVAIRTAQLGESNPQTLMAMHELAAITYDQGRPTEALKLAMRVLALRRATLGPAHRNTVESANLAACLLREHERLPEADQLLTDAVNAARRTLAPTDEHLISAIGTLGSIRESEYRYADAEQLLREAADSQKMLHGAEHPATLTALNDLALTYRDEGKLDQATKLLEQILEVRRRILGPDHAHTILSMNNLAAVYRSQNLLTQAETVQRAALEAGTRTVGPDHPLVATMLYNLGETYRLENKLEPAVEATTKALADYRKLYGNSNVHTINALGNLAQMYLAGGNAAGAEPLLREAIDVAPKAEAPRWKIEQLKSELGLALMRLKRFSEAEPVLLSSYEGLCAAEKKIPASRKRLITDTGRRIVELYTAAGRNADATEWKQKLAQREQPAGPAQPAAQAGGTAP